MKKFAGFFLVLILLSLSVFFHQCYPAQEKTDQEKTKIVLVHPSAEYLKSFLYLIENNIIRISDLELIAVFYAKTKSDFEKSIKFLEENERPFINLQKIDGDLNRDNLFQKNSCSNDFYKIFKNSDGILFFGGFDLPPSIYAPKTSLLTNIKNPHRHYFELSFMFHLLGGSQNDNFQPYLEEKTNYVVNGFCLGMQSMNVATGGSLYQDIPSEIYGLKYVEDVLSLDQDQQHKNYWRALFGDDDLVWCNFHRIKLVEDQFFIKNLKLSVNEHPYVTSGHHQAVKHLGKGFKVVATSMDGKVIEAIAHQKYINVFGVQFHPEFFDLYAPEEKKYKLTPNDTELFSQFEILQKTKSLQFHYQYWRYFGQLFSPRYP
jgi:putative glutamine amidotransferase